jgi:release factor glutamine methyltransferase
LQKISKEVYAPSEDSYLLSGCILKEKLIGKKCLDLGTGSGVQGIAMLSAGAESILSVDINPFALKESKKNISNWIKENRPQFLGLKTSGLGKAVFRKSNLFSNIKEKFDFVAFNPPYVPSDNIKWVDLDGGENGRVVIDRFLLRVRKHLNKNGVLLLLVSSLNKPGEIKSMLKKQSFKVKIVGRKKLFFEELLVLRCKLT